MRFMLIVKANEQSEAGVMPSRELIAEMMKFNEKLANAGVLLSLDGLHPSSKGARVSFKNGKPTVTDGPFSETKELIGGYWFIEAASREEAIGWAMLSPAPNGNGEGIIEVRQLVEMSDFPADTIDQDAIDRVLAAKQGA